MDEIGLKQEKNGNDGRRRLSWGETGVSESKLLPVIHGLLTTTGCGPLPRRPQPMGIWVLTVNEFVVRKPLIFSTDFACRDWNEVRTKTNNPAPQIRLETR